MENNCLHPPRRTRKFIIKQHAPNHWYFALLEPNGEAAFVSPVRYNSAEEARAVVVKLRGDDTSRLIETVPLSPFDRSQTVI